MGKLFLVNLIRILLCLIYITAVQARRRECPPPSFNTKCNETCTRDNECGINGGRCCRNICDQYSCLQLTELRVKNNDDLPYNYCGNALCVPPQKCLMKNPQDGGRCVAQSYVEDEEPDDSNEDDIA